MQEMSPSSNPEPKRMSRAMLAIIVIVALIIFAAIAALMVTYTSQAPTTTQNEQTNTPSPSATDNDTASTTDSATISFTNDGFSPATLTVKKGTKVTVVNNSSDPVQFSSDDHPTHREDPEINMDELQPGESGSFTVTTVGTHGFHDHIDDRHAGTLIVTE